MKVIYSEDVIDFLADLIETLYNKDYFGFKEAAKEYVQELVDEIDTAIERKQKKLAPTHFDRYGKNMYYISYRRSKNTQWYVFFNYSSEVYYIRFIGNNHNIGQYL